MTRIAGLIFLLAACADQGDAPEPARLVDVADAPPDAACPRGSITVTAGNDDNGDGELAPDEIDDTQHACKDTVIHGDLVIEDAFDVARATGVTAIEGSLIIDAVAPADLSALTRIGGSLIVRRLDAPLAAPSLTDVGGSVEVQATGLALPALRSLGYLLRIEMTGAPTTVELPALTAVPNDIFLRGSLAFSAPLVTSAGNLTVDPAEVFPAPPTEIDVTAISMPALTTLRGTLGLRFTHIATLALPALTHAARIQAVENRALCTSVLEALVQRTGGDDSFIANNKDC